MSKLKLREIGNSVGIILPKDLLAELGAEIGDEIEYVVKGRGLLELSVADEEVDELMKLAEQVMDENRVVLRALAK
ncbi:MAG: AbrB/MazE/SpoVT family DNA-binding domain-containing protein [Pseudomonadota bacterium]